MHPEHIDYKFFTQERTILITILLDHWNQTLILHFTMELEKVAIGL